MFLLFFPLFLKSCLLKCKQLQQQRYTLGDLLKRLAWCARYDVRRATKVLNCLCRHIQLALSHVLLKTWNGERAKCFECECVCVLRIYALVCAVPLALLSHLFWPSSSSVFLSRSFSVRFVSIPGIHIKTAFEIVYISPFTLLLLCHFGTTEKRTVSTIAACVKQ